MHGVFTAILCLSDAGVMKSERRQRELPNRAKCAVLPLTNWTVCCVDRAQARLPACHSNERRGGAVRVLFCVLALTLSSCAKSDLAKHSEVANRVLTERGTPDFEDASTEAHAAVRHTPSGMICVLPADGAFTFDLFPASAVNAGAQCSSTEGEQMNAWVAVRFREPTNLDAVVASAVAQLVDTGQAQPWEGRPSAADRSSPEGLPHFRISRFEIDLDGERRYLRLAVSEANGWYLQQIVSSPLAAAEETEAASGEEWRESLRAFVATASQSAAPTDGAAH